MYITDEDIKNYRKGIDCKLTIDGITKSYPSYLVPLEGLYFNDLNGRIATYVEENASNPDKSIDLESLLRNNDLETYNDRIAEFIKQSANDGGVSFNKTKEDIKEKGQIKPGVILRSGRIIDGNRRFTCLRELYRDSGDTKFDFFECVRTAKINSVVRTQSSIQCGRKERLQQDRFFGRLLQRYDGHFFSRSLRHARLLSCLGNERSRL